jgi:very-short-patch-repair endonuclease
MSRKLTKDEILSRLESKYDGRYSYDIEDNFKNLHHKMKIICKEHGESYIIIWDHISGSICKGCSNENRKNLQKIGNSEFIKRSIDKLGSGKYDYSMVEYINNRTKVKIRCVQHNHIFEQLPNQHINGNISCTYCKKINSVGESKIREILNSLGVNFKEQHSFNDCRNKNILKFDFYLPNQNLIIEYDGKQHFIKGWNSDIEFERIKLNDKIKNKYCLENNIRLIRIPYTQFKNIENILIESIKQDGNLNI